MERSEPSSGRYPTAASAGNSSERRKSVLVIPAGRSTRSRTRSWVTAAAGPLGEQSENAAFELFATEDQIEQAVTDFVSPDTEAAEKAAAVATGEKAGRDEPVVVLSSVSVEVLNGNGVAGAAAIGSERVRRHQYLIAGTDNAPRTSFSRSIVMYRPGYEAEGRRLANDLKLKRVVPLDGMRARDLQGAHPSGLV